MLPCGERGGFRRCDLNLVPSSICGVWRKGSSMTIVEAWRKFRAVGGVGDGFGSPETKVLYWYTLSSTPPCCFHLPKYTRIRRCATYIEQSRHRSRRCGFKPTTVLPKVQYTLRREQHTEHRAQSTCEPRLAIPSPAFASCLAKSPVGTSRAVWHVRVAGWGMCLRSVLFTFDFLDFF